MHFFNIYFLFLLNIIGNSNVRLNEEVILRIKQKLKTALINETFMKIEKIQQIYSIKYNLSTNDNDIFTILTTKIISKLIFVRNLNEKEYVTLCAVSDIILDPFPVGGG